MSTTKIKYQYKPGEQLFVDPNAINLLENKRSDETHFDVRALSKPDPALVEDFKHHGWRGSVVMVRERAVNEDEPDMGTELVIVAGRRRVIAAREAGIQAMIEVQDPHLPEYEYLGAMITENELRLEDNPVNKARKVKRFVDAYCEFQRPGPGTAGVEQDEEGNITYNGVAWQPSKELLREARNEAAKRSGINERRVRQYFQFLEMSPKVIKACEQGHLTLDAALVWAGDTVEKQESRLEKELGRLEERKAAAREGKAEKRKGKAGGRALGNSKISQTRLRGTKRGSSSGMTPGQVNKVLLRVKEAFVEGDIKPPEAIVTFVQYLTGDMKEEEAFASLKWLAKAFAPVEEDGDEE